MTGYSGGSISLNEFELHLSHDVGTGKAWAMSVSNSGDLIFTDDNNKPILIYARGTWVKCRKRDAEC